MESHEVVRDDFPSARKGWDPDAVRAHLEAVAAEISRAQAEPASEAKPISEVAAEAVRAVIDAAELQAVQIREDATTEVETSLSASRDEAEATLAEARNEAVATIAEARAQAATIPDEARGEAEAILDAARAEADDLVTTARAEGEQLLDSARSDANLRVAEAQGAVETLISQARELGNRVERFGEELSRGSHSAASRPGPPPPAPEPEPLLAAKVAPPLEAEDAPLPEPDPPLPAEDSRLAAADPPIPAHAPEPASTPEEAIAQLRGGTPREPPAEIPFDLSAPGIEEARMVAAGMALEGKSREEIAASLESEFGEIADVDPMIDSIIERFGH